MRILAVTNLFPNPLQPRRGTFNLQQFRALAASHDVRVIAPISWTWEYFVSQTESMPQGRRVVRDGMTVDHPHYLYTPKIFRGMYGHFFLRSIRASFHAAVEAMRPDVVLGCWAYPDGWAAARLAREAGLPIAIKVHGSDLLTAGAGSPRERGAAEALCAADAVVAVSADLAARAAALGVPSERIHLIRNGIDTDRFRAGDRDEARTALGIEGQEPIVLFVGNLIPVKGPDLFLQAFARLVQCRPRIRCVLVGHGPMESSLRRMAADLGIEEQVRFAGSRPHEELPLWYRAAHCLIVPSRSEGVPNVLLEATACGTPWVATRVGGVLEVAPTSMTVPPEDPAALAGVMNELLVPGRVTPPSLRLPTDSWSASAERLGSLLASIVERHSSERRRTA
jgi:glycosyltransferase involved in cell wall biosynthesis